MRTPWPFQSVQCHKNSNTNTCHNPNCRYSVLIILWQQSLILKNLFISKPKLILLKNTPNYHDRRWLRSVCMVPTTEWCQLHWMGNVDGGWVEWKGVVGASFCGVGHQWQNQTGSRKWVGKTSHKEKCKENEWGKSENDHEGWNITAGSHMQAGSNGDMGETCSGSLGMRVSDVTSKMLQIFDSGHGEWQIDYSVD